MALDKITFRKIRHYRSTLTGKYMLNLKIVREVKDCCWYIYVNGVRVPDYSIKKDGDKLFRSEIYIEGNDYMLLKKGGFLKVVDGTFKLTNKDYNLRFSVYPTLEKAKRALLDHLYPK